MAEEADATKTLATVREKLVEERRSLAVIIALGYRRRRTDDSHTNEVRESFIGIQNLIEAIDRASADEKLIAGGAQASCDVPRVETAPTTAPALDGAR